MVARTDSELINAFIAWASAVEGMSRNTVTSYRRELEALSASKGPLATVETAQLIEYIHERGGRATTQARRYSALNTFFRYLVRHEIRPTNPVDGLRRPRIPRRDAPLVTDAASQLEDLPQLSRKAAEFILETGVRLGELLSIKTRGRVGSQIVVEGRKRERRTISLSPRAQALLEELGGSVGINSRTFQKHLERVGLTPELLRHASLRSVAIPPLHPRLERKLRRLIDNQEGQEAVFVAYREIEIRVRELAQARADDVGVPLMRSAFAPNTGPLADTGAPRAEQQARSDLFAGAIGSFKNPSSHRSVAAPAAEIVDLLTLANLLMRILDRVQADVLALGPVPRGA